MRVLLLSAHADYYSTRKILEAFQAKGHDILHVDPARIELGPGESGRALRHGGKDIGPFDFCIPRLTKSHLEHTFTILDALGHRGAHTINPLRGLMAARDKFKTYQALAAAEIATPPTTLVCDPDHVEAAAESVGGFPLVLKPLHATQGSGVALVRNAATAKVLLRHFIAHNEGAVFQAFLPEAAGGDVRLITAGARVLGAIRRHGAIGDFRANLHQGGCSEPFAAPDVLKDLACRAAASLGLRFAGVDVLVTRNEFHVIEINASPGLAGFERSTGIDVGAGLVTLAERILEQQQP